MNQRDNSSSHPVARGKRLPRRSSTRQASVHAGPRYGILGGTFDPPHLAHLVVAQEVYVRLALDRVWFLPAGEPPHKPGRAISAAADRLAMVERAIAADDRFAVSTVELERPGPSYTVDTLREVRAIWGASAWIVLIMGWDMLEYLPNWHDAAGVLAGADQIAAVHRPGFAADDSDIATLEAQLPGLRAKLALVPGPQLAISGTEIRTRVAQKLPVRYLTPDAVASYIEMRSLYRVESDEDHNRSNTPSEPGGKGTQMKYADLGLGDRVRLRKPHPCGSADWRVVRLGADIGLKCEGCGRRVLLPRSEVERRIKQILSRGGANTAHEVVSEGNDDERATPE